MSDDTVLVPFSAQVQAAILCNPGIVAAMQCVLKRVPADERDVMRKLLHDALAVVYIDGYKACRDDLRTLEAAAKK